jgi:hypothetical protein
MNLEGWLSMKETDPDIRHAIVNYFKSWRNGQPQVLFCPFLLEGVLYQQSLMGWRRFFEGWLVREWMNAQQAYYKIKKSLSSGRRWAIELKKKMWDVAWDLWEHPDNILHKAENGVSVTASWALNRQVSLAFNDLQSLLLPSHDRLLLSLNLAKNKPSTYVRTN